MVLKLGIEVEILARPGPTGVERALRLWLEGLAAVRDVEVRAFSRTPVPSLPEGIRAHTLPSRLPLFLWREWVLPGALAGEEIQVFLSPVTAFPLRSPAPVVATIHELPWLEEGVPPPSRRERTRVRLALRRAALVLAVSEATGARCLEFARKEGFEPRPLRVVPHGFRPFRPAPPPLPTEDRKPLVLGISAPRPRKNLPAWIRAFALAAGEVPGARFILVGPEGKERERLARLARNSGVERKVFLPGRLPDPDLADLLSRAALLLHAPLSEGFGFPPLEALSLGCLPVLSRRGALPEVCRDAALYADDPPGPGAIARVLVRALKDPASRREHLSRAPEVLARFDPARALEPLLRACREAARPGA